jgi:hypothetical protein
MAADAIHREQAEREEHTLSEIRDGEDVLETFHTVPLT